MNTQAKAVEMLLHINVVVDFLGESSLAQATHTDNRNQQNANLLPSSVQLHYDFLQHDNIILIITMVRLSQIPQRTGPLSLSTKFDLVSLPGLANAAELALDGVNA